MFRWVLLFVFLFLCSCDSHHPQIYVYKSQAYTSNEIDEFEVDHYKTFGNSNFLVIDDEKSIKDTERIKAIDSLCEQYQVTCTRLDMSKKDDKTLASIVKTYQQFGEQKFFVFSPNKLTTARFAGTLNRLLHSGNEKSIEVILKTNGIDESDPIKDYLLSLKKVSK